MRLVKEGVHRGDNRKRPLGNEKVWQGVKEQGAHQVFQGKEPWRSKKVMGASKSKTRRDIRGRGEKMEQKIFPGPVCPFL